MKDSGNSVQSFHQSYPSRCMVMEACACMFAWVCVCVRPCFTSRIHHRALSPGPGKRAGESLEGLGCRLQHCTLTKHLFHKINASRLLWVSENPGRRAFAATHLIPITSQTGSEPAESMDTDWSRVLDSQPKCAILLA